ncbi:MAG: nucleotidyltransferase substrate binding protein [Deltaproteobacteria bacterium]|nr:nucleotidyltransferase substrate binding protein [Deltaproteobacteria bacterium]
MKIKKETDSKLKESIEALEHALTFAKKIEEDGFYYFGISKCYETCLEYAWKFCKKRANSEGLEVYSPKDAIRAAGQLKLIDDIEKWIDFLEDRNIGVHDYLGISRDDYLKTIRSFLTEVKKLADG